MSASTVSRRSAVDGSGRRQRGDLDVNTRPLISVIVRSMDRPSLGAALDSIAEQTYHPIEIVVVPAAGGLHSPIPSELQGVTLRSVPVTAALARSAAANAGLQAARGAWLIFLDDDDLFLPDHLGKLADALSEHAECIAAYSDVDFGRSTSEGWVPLHCFAAEFDPHRLRFENYLPIHAVLFRRDLVSGPDACRFDESLNLFEDWDFWLQLAARGSFVRAPGVSARYLTSPDGGRSGVFDDATPTIAARDQLLAKWQQRDSAEAYGSMLRYVQRLYREGAAAQEILTARAVEIADLHRHASNLQAVIASREADLANALRRVDDVLEVLAARDIEIGALKTSLAAHLAQNPWLAFKSALKRRLNG